MMIMIIMDMMKTKSVKNKSAILKEMYHMKNEGEQSRETLLNIIASYIRMIDFAGGDYPAIVLNDIKVSAEYVLKRNNYA